MRPEIVPAGWSTRWAWRVEGSTLPCAYAQCESEQNPRHQGCAHRRDAANVVGSCGVFSKAGRVGADEAYGIFALVRTRAANGVSHSGVAYCRCSVADAGRAWETMVLRGAVRKHLPLPLRESWGSPKGPWNNVYLGVPCVTMCFVCI